MKAYCTFSATEGAIQYCRCHPKIDGPIHCKKNEDCYDWGHPACQDHDVICDFDECTLEVGGDLVVTGTYSDEGGDYDGRGGGVDNSQNRGRGGCGGGYQGGGGGGGGRGSGKDGD
ncbi:hypothetical protein ACFE04_015423 [Oxalis oulophora]